MMGINLKDIVELAKAGYKVSEVKELISLANQSEAPATEEKENQTEKTEQHEDGKEQPDKAPQNVTDNSSEDSTILSYKQKVEELEAQIKTLQASNVHKDQSDKKDESDEELLIELAQSYM